MKITPRAALLSCVVTSEEDDAPCPVSAPRLGRAVPPTQEAGINLLHRAGEGPAGPPAGQQTHAAVRLEEDDAEDDPFKEQVRPRTVYSNFEKEERA